MPDKTSLTYTHLFCEENIWKLIESMSKMPEVTPIDVLFLINPGNSVVLYQQKQAAINMPVVWDYHVILSAKSENQLLIFDYDSRCNFPTPLDIYFAETFQYWNLLGKEYQPLIRPVPSDYYMKHFSSDRTHMQGIISDHLFPDYPVICNKTSDTALTLAQCRDSNTVNETLPILTPAEYLASVKVNRSL